MVAHVICLQETHCSSVSECSSWFASSGLSCVVSPGSTTSCGCVMLYCPFLSIVSSRCDSNGRFLQCEFSFHGCSFRVACVYAPNRNPAQDKFLDDISSLVDPTVPTILCGDFNTIFDRLLERSGSVVGDQSRESTVALGRLLDSCCVLHIRRYLHPSSSALTWSRWDGSMSSRIDLVGCPYSWGSSVSSCEIFPCPFSDHCAVQLCVSVPDVVPPGPGLWKLNTSILEDDAYVESVSSLWLSWKSRQLDFPSLAKWWEEGKSRIKGLTI